MKKNLVISMPIDHMENLAVVLCVKKIDSVEKLNINKTI